MRARRTLGLLAALAAATAPRPAAAQAPEPTLLEVRLGRIVTRTVEAWRAGDVALLPVGAVLALAEVRGAVSGAVATARLEPNGTAIRVDAAARTASLDRQMLPLEASQVLAADGEVFLDATVLARLLGVDFLVDWGELRVDVPEAGALPVARRIEREEARRVLLAERGGGGAVTEVAVPPARWDGLVVDYLAQAGGRDPLAAANLQLGVGADLLGGSLEVLAQSAGLGAGAEGELGASWLGVWPASERLRQVRLGDAYATGPRARALRGASATNAPYVRDQFLHDAAFDGMTGPGWTIEAFAGGSLVAFDSSDAYGRYSVEVPVRYGENPVEFVAYGPNGEVRSFTRTYQAVQAQLPARAFEYGAAAGTCRRAACDESANLDLRYGASDRWTVRGGLEASTRAAGMLLQPYGAVTATPVNPLAVELEVLAQGYLRGALRFQPTADLRLGVEAARFDAEVTDPVLTAAGQTSQARLGLFWRPVPSNPFLYVDGSVEHAGTRSGDRTAVRLGASLQRSALRVAPYVRVTSTGGRSFMPDGTFVGVSGYLLPGPRAGPILNGLWTRGRVEVRGAAFSALELTLARNLTPAVRLEGGVAWREPERTVVTLGVTTAFPALRAGAAVASAPGGALTSQFVQGSVVWNRAAGRLATTPGPSLERAGVAGRVFLDRNADGRRGPDEPGLGALRLTVGSTSVTTDSLGRYEAWNLLPFEAVVVTLDTLSLESPLLVPAVPALRLVPAPNRFVTLDVAVVEATVLDGAVVLRDGGATRPLPGVDVVVREVRTGRVLRTRTFGDGTFYLTGLVAGEWEVAVDPAAAERLGAASTAVRLVVRLEDLAAGVAGVVVEVGGER
ncbi:MAG TPA: carboxypeptidase-like regulatory domain-containing protein [Gemmatimonadales bacterium]|nr:carboxypeptidase-like regulatory domain-containing protein [Gemmatimonadales bacterium]